MLSSLEDRLVGPNRFAFQRGEGLQVWPCVETGQAIQTPITVPNLPHKKIAFILGMNFADYFVPNCLFILFTSFVHFLYLPVACNRRAF